MLSVAKKISFSVQQAVAQKCIPLISLIGVSFQIKWFDDPVSRCMQHLDGIETKDLTQKCEFFTKLAQTIPQFPRVSIYSIHV